jgi:tetratricopeptide (TPR) repeat protein
MERYDQTELIRKYYRNQLSGPEQVAFNQLRENPAFQQELIRFTLLRDLLEVQALRDEAAAILSGLETAPFPSSLETAPQLRREEESKDEDVLNILRQARKAWEQDQQQDGRGETGLSASEALATPKENQDSGNGKAVKLGNGQAKPGQNGARVKRRRTWQWLAAAVTISFVCFGGLWWYEQNKTEDVKVSTKQRPSDSPKVANNKPDRPIDTIKSETDSLNPSPPPARELAVVNRPISRAEQQRLVKSNFVADSLPSEILEDLEIPADLYKNQQHQAAIVAYKKVLEAIDTPDPELASRSQEESKLTAFLAHYYIGQSYFALGHTTPAIAALKSAIKEPPTPYWKSKTEWYLALAYLKAGQIQQARKLLQRVAGNKEAGAYRQKARQLNRKLEKP